MHWESELEAHTRNALRMPLTQTVGLFNIKLFTVRSQGMVMFLVTANRE